jgi:phosphopantothenoylcysteine decarboxylase/phosphopantothenate--cysteine ligase
VTKRIVLGVAGGIAAYKCVELCRRLTEAGHDVTVIPTAAALNFVGAATWAAISHNAVSTDVWDRPEHVNHVALGRAADLVIVAPATADLMARAAHGQADDLLTNTLLTARCPVLFAPAMHTEMWEHAATVDNVATLRRRGATVLEPATGRLTGTDSGKGRLPEPSEIAEIAALLLHSGQTLPRDLDGLHMLITAGGTREPLDPVRYLGNRSSGKQGYALARAGVLRGARVTLVSANAELGAPAGCELIEVGTAEQLREATQTAAKSADVVVMAAAVADFRPLNTADHKIKKSDADPDPVALTRNRDVLAELVAARNSGELRSAVILVGFAAETGDDNDDVLSYGRAKLARKGCDLLVVNAVGDGRAFGSAVNAAVLLGRDGIETTVGLVPKIVLANVVWDSVSALLSR